MPYLTRDMLGLKKGDEVKVGRLYENKQFGDRYITKEEFTAVDIALMLEVGMLMEDEPASDWNEAIIPPSRLQLEKESETPWKPQPRQKCWIIMMGISGVSVGTIHWEGDYEEMEALKEHLIFPTEVAALAKAEEIRKVLKK